MRSDARVGAACAVLLVVLAGCSGDDGGAVDLEALEVTLGDPVEPDGRTIGVSPLGQALVDRDDEMCIVELDGASGPCLGLDVEVAQVSWSPDGSRAVVGDDRALASFLDADLTVIEIEDGSFEVVTDDGTDEADGDIDFAPVWLDDDTIAFLRWSGGFDGDLQRVTLELGEEPAAVDVDLEPLPIQPAAPLGDQLLVQERTDSEVELVSVAEDGTVETVLDLQGGSLVGASSTDRRAVAVSTADVFRAGPTAPVGFVELDAAPVLSDFTAGAAAVSPDGRLVAALTGEDALLMEPALTIWDPGEAASRDFGAVEPGYAITWTLDDRLVVWSGGGWQVIELERG